MFETYQSLELLAPLWRKVDMCVHGLCWTEFNVQQLLWETFSLIMRIFGSVESQTESTFPFQYNIIFETCDVCHKNMIFKV